MNFRAAPSHLDSVTRYLSWDHDRLDGILGEATRRVEAGSVSEARIFFATFDQGLRRHIRAEETILFPLFEARTGGNHALTEVLRREDRAIEAALGCMRMALETGDVAEYGSALASLYGLLEPHNAKEEQVLYPATDELVTDPAERNELLDRLIRV
jgi:iron-sulfur cluster repair protein YtfE (RIC family)